ncbi:phosphoribosylamine-glycine ligase [Haloarcula marismortui ATCC 43049]|uniref:phosphoribosylamine--glycine ligase n=1 Tax=Haloarcula marismortui (strain ATCC 43049 / DSM 3752 / JCM 8966 / VKM B-1809) TaxID=272569 RepID=Q5V540_HALMA|nr:phosphoribosylglycinamide synthetase C domain-containing protein [Haloarcula marismortui]AAV45362.1 phosphoribosylamine-glycine ligase [Haloarcula marismortui ATCC 43049]QCP93140.1 phosphoribosylamine--glycine ligase [Haloarcula marismortui ATCC 43049]
MANFLFCSLDAALIGDIAWQVTEEGHDVRYYIEANSDQEIADGFVPKTDDWREDLDWADVVIFDDIWVGSDIGTGEIARELRAEGHAVVGGTPNTDALEEDRGYAMEILEDHGVNTIEHHVFEDFDAGIQHVQENPAPYVIKPLGEVQNVKRLLYVGNEDDGSDIVDVLRAYKKAWGHRMKGFQLQRKVAGVEIAVCGFFNGDSFVEPVNFNFEHKKLFPGNIGPSTGEMGTSMFWAGRNELFEETLGKVEGWLADEGYVGSIDINCIVNDSGIYPLEFTPRFGYPTIALQEESFESETGQFFLDLAHGRDPDLKVHRGYQVAVRVVLPPFPFDDEETYDENSRNAAVVFESDSREGIHIEDAKRVDEQWRVAGESGMPLVVTGKGETMQAAREQAYKRVDAIRIPNRYYRDDIGERWIDGDGDRLQAWGYLGPAL